MLIDESSDPAARIAKGAKHGSPPCAACGGELFQFAPPPSVRGIDRSRLPTVCRRCQQICVGNEPVTVSTATTNLADETARQGRLARERLLSDPTLRIERYFGEVYCTGFLHGFCGALSYFIHHTKEGRLRRLRGLWKQSETYAAPEVVEIRMSAQAFHEFQRLLDGTFTE